MNCKVEISQIKKYVSKNKYLKLNSVGNKFNKEIFSKSNKKKALK